MNPALLDVNVLVGTLMTSPRVSWTVQDWFARNSRHGWVTCPFTQAGFGRIVSNPSLSPDAIPPEEAATLLEANLKHPHHRFWGDEIGLPEAIEPFCGRIIGHRQVTDAYLLGLAMHKRGRLVTLDRAVKVLLPAGSPHQGWLDVIAP